MIGKASAEKFLMFGETNLLENKSLLQKLLLTGKYIPVFSLTAVFRLGKIIATIITLLFGILVYFTVGISGALYDGVQIATYFQDQLNVTLENLNATKQSELLRNFIGNISESDIDHFLYNQESENIFNLRLSQLLLEDVKDRLVCTKFGPYLAAAYYGPPVLVFFLAFGLPFLLLLLGKLTRKLPLTTTEMFQGLAAEMTTLTCWGRVGRGGSKEIQLFMFVYHFITGMQA